MSTSQSAAKRPPVVWTDVEQSAVVRESFRLLRDDPTMPGKTAIVQAQNACLPPERRKRPISFHPWSRTEKWFAPAVGKLAAERIKGEAEVLARQEAEVRAQAEATAAADAQIAAAQAAAVAVEESKPAAPKVFWNAAEKLEIAKHCVRILRESPHLQLLDALRLAAKEMPENRRRTFATVSAAEQWLVPLMKQARQHERDEREALERHQREEEARQREEAEQERQAKEAREREERDREVAKQAAEAAARVAAPQGSATVEGLIAELGKRIAAMLLEQVGNSLEFAIQERVSAALSSMTLPTVAAASPYEGVQKVMLPPKERKARVCVVGLLNQQAEDVKRHFGQIDFTFIKSQQQGGNAHGGSGMLSRASECDFVIAMTDFMGHDVEYAAKKLTIPFIRIVGSVSALKRWLQRWSNGEIALANH